MATSGDLDLATSGDFLMATDTKAALCAPRRGSYQRLTLAAFLLDLRLRSPTQTCGHEPTFAISMNSPTSQTTAQLPSRKPESERLG